MEDFECEFDYLTTVHEYHSASSSSSRKGLWHEFISREELSLGQLFCEIKKTDLWRVRNPCSKNTDIVDLKFFEFAKITRWSIILLREGVYQVTSVKVYVFTDSVLCMDEMGDYPNAAWMNKIYWNSENNHFKELNRFDDMQTEFEWKILSGFTTLEILEKIQKYIQKYTVWTWAFLQQNHIHVNVQRHCRWCKRNQWIICK